MPIPFDVKEAMDTGFFVCGTSQTGKTTVAKWLAKALIESGVTVYVIDTSQAWNHDSPIGNVVKILPNQKTYDMSNSTVLDVSGITSQERVSFVNQFCRQLYNRHVNQKCRYREFVIFEEAQTYLPNGSMRLSVRRKPIYDAVVDIVTVGANYGLRFGLITQFPALVDKSPVKISQQRYFGWTWEKNDIAYMKGFLGKEWISELQKLGKGEFIHQNRDRTEKIKVEPFGTPSIKNDAKAWGKLEFAYSFQG